MGKRPINSEVQFWRDPDLPGVEVRYSSYNVEAFRKHTHDAYSIGLIENGRTAFVLEDTAHGAKAGQIALIHPGEAHACNPDLESGITYSMFYVDSTWLENVAAEIHGRETGPPRFSKPVINDPTLFAAWRSVYTAIVDGAERLEKETLLVQALADLITRHTLLEEVHASPDDDEAVRRIRDRLAADPAEKISLEALSEVAHRSPYHLLRTFQDSMGLTPHAYQNQLRVDLGKRLLGNGMPISQVAAETGFVDQSHFSRVFKQHTGATPRQYQAGFDVKN